MDDIVKLWLKNKKSLFQKYNYISNEEINDFLLRIKMLIFNEYYKYIDIYDSISKISSILESFLIRLNYKNEEIKRIIDSFQKALIKIEKYLYLDLDNYLNSDPAIIDKEEFVLSSLAFFAILGYRVAHELILLGIKILPKMISEYIHSNTGIDINPNAKIGYGFVIDHGTGVVIGETSIIGNNVKLFHGVTLGSKKITNLFKLKNEKRHPTLEDNVIICSNSSILGDIIIKKGAIIGTSLIIDKNVEENEIVRGTRWR